ncbi:hypothetical protein ABK046_44380, partial [Streptomyces caeruleatus]
IKTAGQSPHRCFDFLITAKCAFSVIRTESKRLYHALLFLLSLFLSLFSLSLSSPFIASKGGLWKATYVETVAWSWFYVAGGVSDSGKDYAVIW